MSSSATSKVNYSADGAQNDLWQRAKAVFPGGVNSPVRAFRSVGLDPFTVAKGEGPYLYDVSGKRYVDWVCSWGPLVLGHAHPAVVEAISQQARLGTTFGANSVPEVLLAEKIISLMPGIERLRFVSSGTEAGMSVLRLARAYTKRSKILKFRGCYHGHTDSLLVQAGSGVLTLSLPDSPGVNASTAAETLVAEFNDITSVENLFNSYADQIAAVIVEPVVGNAGFIEPLPGFLEGLRILTQKNGALLIFDEVMTGFRVDRKGAQGLFGITPDLTMLGKVIGGGLPVGAFGGRAEIMDHIAPAGSVYQAGTLSGNPLAMMAGLVTLEKWCEDEIFWSASMAATCVVEQLKESAEEAGIPLVASSLGTMFGFFFTASPVTSFAQALQSDVARFKKFFGLMLNEGIYFAPSPYEAGFSSAVHRPDAVEETCAAIKKVMPLCL